jgi:hypothetical protein
MLLDGINLELKRLITKLQTPLITTKTVRASQQKYRLAASFTSLSPDEMAPSLKKHFRLVLGLLSVGLLFRLALGLLSIMQRSRSLEHVDVVAGISWIYIRVMCWNFREPKAPVCFKFFNFHPVCTKYISHEHRTYYSYKSYAIFFWNCYFLAGKFVTNRCQKIKNKL